LRREVLRLRDEIRVIEADQSNPSQVAE